MDLEFAGTYIVNDLCRHNKKWAYSSDGRKAWPSSCLRGVAISAKAVSSMDANI